VVLHGAGQSESARFSRLRQELFDRGILSAAFDFIGHGRTGGNLQGSSLRQREEAAAAVIRFTGQEPLTLIGASMGGHTAIRLTRRFTVEALVLLVPAVYARQARDLPFGPEFSAAIRRPMSWLDSDAFDILSDFRGNLLVVAAESDEVIPRPVIERIHASAARARTREIHTVPGSGHRSLFPREEDLVPVLDKIARLVAGNGTKQRPGIPGGPS
jgi:pimeloyl-ACP methyl ester carboxylesterase